MHLNVYHERGLRNVYRLTSSCHVPMLRVDEKGRSHPVEDEETYRLNVRSSYEKLLEAIGDMTIEGGRPGLTRLMRPPQLAISRNG